MPNYLYQCELCGAWVIVTRGFHCTHPMTHGEADDTNCQDQLSRKCTPTNVIYRPSGFYTTDSRWMYDNAEDDDGSED
ncbi:MAG: hypothetical protein PVF74_10370 [Anaerolineales bacterium]|jgi:predicted nucleic acid-binding Zn ribbon protein